MNEAVVATVDVPEHLRPATPEQDVDVAIVPKRVVSDAEAEQAAKDLGLAVLDVKQMKAMEVLGIYTDGMMAVNMSRGRTVVTLETIRAFIQRLDETAENTTDDQVKISASVAAASLFDKFLGAEKHLVQLYQLVPQKAQGEGKRRNRSFAPGQQVHIGVQINPPQPAPAPEGTPCPDKSAQ